MMLFVLISKGSVISSSLASPSFIALLGFTLEYRHSLIALVGEVLLFKTAIRCDLLAVMRNFRYWCQAAQAA